MTEDPVKLYVIVMAILLAVLGFVALDSYRQAHAYEAALERAGEEAKQMRQLASEVQALLDQISRSALPGGKKTLIENAERKVGVVHSTFNPDDAPIGRGVKGREERFKVSFGTGRSSPPLTREQVVRFCHAVERDSQGILKTIELNLTRVSGQGAPEVGHEGKITGERYKGDVVFGLRVVEQ